MILSTEEAINRINESVTVKLLVQKTKCCTGSRQAFLDSEPNHRDPKNLGVVVTETGRAKFAESGIDGPEHEIGIGRPYQIGRTLIDRKCVSRERGDSQPAASPDSQVGCAHA